MSTYIEDIAAIRNARKSRVEAEDALYSLKIRYSNLLKKKKKFAVKEVADDPEKETRLNSLRLELAAHQKNLDKLERELQQMSRLSRNLQQKLTQVQALQTEIE